jgi:CRP-like cAMP-binding protein
MMAFRKFIENYVSVPDNEWKIIEQAFERKEFTKNEIILTEGTICRYFYFLEKGLIRYYIFKDGNDITKFFTLAPFCFTAKESFRNRKPSEENIEAVTAVVVWKTNWENANALLELRSWNEFTRKFVHEVQRYTEELLIENKTETAELRYQKLLKQHPGLLNEIPLKHLSSYLGIAPQSLSRIRKKWQKQAGN